MTAEGWRDAVVTLENVVNGLSVTALHFIDGLEDTGVPGSSVADLAAKELREHVRVLLEDQAKLATRAMAGLDVSAGQEAIEARAKALAASGILIGVHEIQRSIQEAIGLALRAALGALY